MKLMRPAYIVLVSILACLGFADQAVAAGMRSYVNALIQYWSAFEQGYVPLVLGEGQEVGDVIAVDDHSVLKRRGQCFPNLAAPKTTPQTLPRYVGLDKSATSFLFQLKGLAGLNASENQLDTVGIFYTDASINDLTPDDFKTVLSKECEMVRPLLDNSRNVMINGHDATVIRSIIHARSNVALAVSAGVDAQAKVDSVKKLLPPAGKVLPLDANIEASIGISGKVGVTVTGESLAAVAFRPTHIATSWLGGGDTKRSMIPFDPTDEVQRDMITRASKAWADSLPQ
jgi:hypothetical protein